MIVLSGQESANLSGGMMQYEFVLFVAFKGLGGVVELEPRNKCLPLR
jgi:hypothetical protein